jgi:hypothetical protein
MANPQFKPELLFSSSDKSPSRVLDQMEIPDFGGAPVYIETDHQAPSQQVETPQTFISNTPYGPPNSRIVAFSTKAS